MSVSLHLSTAAAVAFLVAGGAGYRVLAGYLEGQATAKPLPKGTLARLPMRIGEWMGKDSPLGEAVVKATGTDDHVNRSYFRGPTGDRVSLFLAYGVRARDLMPHRPEVCYPGVGWALQANREAALDLPDGSKVQCRVLDFSRGGLSTGYISVLNYYIVDNEFCPDVSLLRSRAWKGTGAIRYMAQVQITSAAAEGFPREAAARAVRSFAVDSAPAVRALLAKAMANQQAAEPRPETD